MPCFMCITVEANVNQIRIIWVLDLFKYEHTNLSVICIFMHYTFLIDVNADGFLDEQELEALFTKEVNMSNWTISDPF